jgi:hypothetical protein
VGVIALAPGRALPLAEAVNETPYLAMLGLATIAASRCG